MTKEKVIQLIKEASKKNLITLYLDGYNLTELPPEIGRLDNLKELNLYGNDLTELPSEIGKLKSLTELNLSRNHLSLLPPEIGELEQLIKLYSFYSQLMQLPSEIGKLKNLREIDLTGNQLTLLPSEIGELTKLTKLSLRHNNLKQLPSEIGKLVNLKNLDISNNQLTQLSPEISGLRNLVRFSLCHNNLTQLPQEIGKLESLEDLDISSNQLTQIPSEIGKFKDLKNLYLSGNHLTQLPPEIKKLKKLVKLDLSENEFTQLPTEIAELTELKQLDVSYNPLISPPPEIVSMGLSAIRTFLGQLKQSKTTENNEAKLILVGIGEVGKTCLTHRLITNEFVEDGITEGINISKWSIPAPDSSNSIIKLNIWDFGGQEIYHATHQFFLTTRSVYLLVWNARKAKDFNNIYSWLHTIEAFGGDSPIILVMSKMNESDDDLNLKDLKNKFPQIVDNFKIDSKDGKGISILKEAISETAWNLPLMRAPWFDSWYKVRGKLEGLKDYWISYDEFYKICVSEGLDEGNINTLDGYLHKLGVILHFEDRLESMVILKPEWVTGAFYKILSAKSVLQREGKLLYSELRQIWDRETYPSNIYPLLMDLMNKFELAYELPDESSYLIPELLPKNAPNFILDEKDNLCFFYCYDSFLPPGIITRFIVLMNHDIEKKENEMPMCWREGVILKLENSRALVEMKPEEKRIEIRIKGDNKREALGIICSHLDHINATIKKIKFNKEIPCNCSENCPQRYPYEGLLKAETEKLENTICFSSSKQVSISSLLCGYKPIENKYKENYENDGRTPIFIINQVETRTKANSISKAELKSKISINVNIDLKVELPYIRAEFDSLKDELENLNPKLDRDMEIIQDSLDEININSDKEKIVKPFNKLYRFLNKLADPNSDYNKVIKGTQKGIEIVQKVGRSYNKFAQWLAMPQIPDLFL